ncbi:hypothetical protein EXM22_05705 [Oceanispirochaeta crateris]|uniref:Transporter n=1 Tax=Oceanispirochaeta crateris TaxID=2518645 RepID=A0A5C1QJL3_9SPIO|nr:hypothetical protein [Oceanispirochaeta crateris]QEN07508.1 hypothetical protein EXM22_05705 [Oceanispirochaeta crateris]
MKKLIFPMFLLALTIHGFSYETGFSTQFGNYGFSEYDSSSTTYTPYFQWGGQFFYFDHSKENENLQYGFILDRNAVQGYSFASELSYVTPYYSIAFGPVFGITNESVSLVKPGFSGSLKGEIPGRAFLEIGGDMIPAQNTGIAYDYGTSTGYYTIGFYLKQDHILCYFTQNLDIYSSLSGSEPYTDSLLTYNFYTDFFEKGSIFKITTKMGYEILSRDFDNGNDIEIRNILLGIQTDFYINSSAAVFIGMDNKIYPGSYGSIDLGDIPTYLITVMSGFKWSS